MLPYFLNPGPFTVPVDEEVEAQHMKFIMAPPGQSGTILPFLLNSNCRTCGNFF